MEATPIPLGGKKILADTVTLDSAVLARLINEVRNDAVSAPTAYDRVHNRHNR